VAIIFPLFFVIVSTHANFNDGATDYKKNYQTTDGPEIKLLEPNDGGKISEICKIRWIVLNAEEHDLRFTIEFSNDNQSSWKIIAYVITLNVYNWDTSKEKGGKYCYFRVSTLINNSVKIFDVNDVPFEIEVYRVPWYKLGLIFSLYIGIGLISTYIILVFMSIIENTLEKKISPIYKALFEILVGATIVKPSTWLFDRITNEEPSNTLLLILMCTLSLLIGHLIALLTYNFCRKTYY